jgi:hypothetical protein
MEEPTLGSLEETSENNSDLRIVLREMIRAHGAGRETGASQR